jgi:hypothetical protein
MRINLRLAAAVIPILLPGVSHALPTMIRLGYPNCASCHISPQGAGLLNAYGRGIDEAQSFKGGDYKPSENPLFTSLNWGGRITQDIRIAAQEQLSTSTGQPVLGVLRSRFMYRNATELGKGFRFSTTITGENEKAPRPTLKYEPPITPGQVYVTSALISYRPKDNLEFAVGRDQLPSGVNIADLATFIKSRERLGYYDAPSQVKMYWWGKRYHVNPYAFGPGGNERSGYHEVGGGMLAEVDVLGHQRTVAGVNFLRGTSHNLNRQTVGPYVRLGFGRWGILAEHDMTTRTLNLTTGANAAGTSFRQDASYVQLFWAAREWLVASAIGERLKVQLPYEEHLMAAKFDLTARLSNRLTVGINTRMQRNEINGKLSPSVAMQLAMKTVN